MKQQAPWLSGIIEALKCVSLIRSSTLSSRNRLSLIILDSTLEISLRQYLQNVKKVTLDPIAHRPRHTLFEIAKKNIDVPTEVWDHLGYYWNTRNPQYHQDANISVQDTVYQEFADLVCFMLDKMFNINSKEYLEFPAEQLASSSTSDAVRIDPKKITSKIDTLIAVLAEPKTGTREVGEALKQLGTKHKFSNNAIRAYLSQKYFYKDELGLFRLSLTGRDRLKQLSYEQKIQ